MHALRFRCRVSLPAQTFDQSRLPLTISASDCAVGEYVIIGYPSSKTGPAAPGGTNLPAAGNVSAAADGMAQAPSSQGAASHWGVVAPALAGSVAGLLCLTIGAVVYRRRRLTRVGITPASPKAHASDVTVHVAGLRREPRRDHGLHGRPSQHSAGGSSG